ncbi:MAG TPA: hypothetical protein VGH97_10340 [Thermoanaerobaculia bacterium]|jgi:hypothetical protein
MDERGEGPNENRFLPILLYVLGFMGALALAALVLGWLLRHL